MDPSEAEFHKRLLATFRGEANEHLQSMSAGLIELEQAAGKSAEADILERVYREAHSFKGAARAVNVTGIEAICQRIESIFAGLKARRISADPAMFDLLLRATALLRELLQSENGDDSSVRMQEHDITSEMDAFLKFAELDMAQERPDSKSIVSVRPEAPGKARMEEPTPEISSWLRPTQTEVIRVSKDKIDALLVQVEDLLNAKFIAGQQLSQLQQIRSSFSGWRTEWLLAAAEMRKIKRTSDVESTGDDRFLKERSALAGFMEQNEVLLQSLEREIARAEEYGRRDAYSVSQMIDHLLESSKRILMQPISGLLQGLPVMVRQLSRSQGKEAELIIEGGEIEMHRRVLEELRDPLTHLVRNAADHGIELPEERLSRHKPPRGKITITVTQFEGNKAEITVSDDGRGIDLHKIRRGAVEAGFLTEDEAAAASAANLDQLIFRSGLSTSPSVTSLSGRGLGLAIVRENIERLGGTVSVESEPGSRASFRLVVPLTLATMRGVVVEVQEQLLVFPVLSISRITRVAREEIKPIENHDTIEVEGARVPLVRLGALLQIPSSPTQESSDRQIAVVVSVQQQSIALTVDALVGEQEILMKPLGPQLLKVRGIAGATVAGRGNLLPVLNVPEIVEIALQAPAKSAVIRSSEQLQPEKRSILVADDSITSRMLLKNILESAGYDVTTAVDGLDALSRLKSGAFDVLISDVDMPSMSGFTLTEKIRADRELGNLPVILVTALHSQEDRERGLEAGANAYIVKSSFDQSNLLSIVERFV